MKDKATIDNLSDRLDRLEAGDEPDNFSDIEYRYGLTEDEYEELTPMEKYILRFNWSVSNILPYYKAEAMVVHNLTSEEYDKRTLVCDTSIYLHQSRKFKPTSYKERVAHVLGLDYQTLQDKIARGEVKDRIAGVNPQTGKDDHWRDEDPNRVFV